MLSVTSESNVATGRMSGVDSMCGAAMVGAFSKVHDSDTDGKAVQGEGRDEDILAMNGLKEAGET